MGREIIGSEKEGEREIYRDGKGERYRQRVRERTMRQTAR
jgi:hypothetical protein